MAVFSVESYK